MDAKRQRRYTIARPESALKLLTENDDALQEEDQQFDRISDILSNLIQEANQAVSIPLTLPRLTNTPYITNKKKSPKRPASYPSKRSLTPMPSSTIMTTRKHHVTQINNTTPVLLESFKRLDSSMAILDSLSKDLIVPAANSVKKQKKKHHTLTFDTRLSALILLPLFHVPHVLISMVFDSISSYDSLMPVTSSAASSQSNSFSGMLIWAFVFAVTNVIMVENTFPSAPTHTRQIIPGAYNSVKRRRRNSSKRSDDSNGQLYLKRHDRAIRALHGSPPPTNSTTLTSNGFHIASAVRARRNSF